MSAARPPIPHIRKLMAYAGLTLPLPLSNSNEGVQSWHRTYVPTFVIWIQRWLVGLPMYSVFFAWRCVDLA